MNRELMLHEKAAQVGREIGAEIRVNRDSARRARWSIWIDTPRGSASWSPLSFDRAWWLLNGVSWRGSLDRPDL